MEKLEERNQAIIRDWIEGLSLRKLGKKYGRSHVRMLQIIRANRILLVKLSLWQRFIRLFRGR